MSSGWNKLDAKFKTRRVVLIVCCSLIILAIGWILGKQMGSAPEPTEPAPVLGQSEERSAADSVGENASSITASAPPSSDPSPGGRALPGAQEEGDPTLQDEEDWAFIQVNYLNPIPDPYLINLEKVSGNYYLDQRIAVPFMQMVAKAKADGINLELAAAYRGTEQQKELFEQAISKKIDETGLSWEEAEDLVAEEMAPPGASDHHTGLAVDILTPSYTMADHTFESSTAYRWLVEHAGEYGFILRYPKEKEVITHNGYEPWHFRYVGTEAAAVIWENDYCLEEYLFLRDKSRNKPVEESSTSEGEGSEESLSQSDHLS